MWVKTNPLCSFEAKNSLNFVVGFPQSSMWPKFVNSRRKGMTSGHCVAGDLSTCEQPFCLIITVYTKEQEYKKTEV